MGLGGAKRSRSPSDASPVSFCLLFRHGKRRSPPAGGEIFLGRRRKRAAQVCRPYGEREGFRAVRTPPLHKKTGLEKAAGSPRWLPRGEISHFPLPISPPLRIKFQKRGTGPRRGCWQPLAAQILLTFFGSLQLYFKEFLRCNNPDALLRFCYTFPKPVDERPAMGYSMGTGKGSNAGIARRNVLF